MKKSKLSILVVILISNLHAAPVVPVVDVIRNKIDEITNVKEIKQLTDGITQLAKEISNIESQITALSELKMKFEHLLNGGLLDEVTKNFDDLLTGSTNSVALSNAKNAFDGRLGCENAKNIELCQSNRTRVFETINNIDSLNNQYKKKMEKIKLISEKATAAKDLMSINEVVTSVQLELTSLELLHQQTESFKKMQTAQLKLEQKNNVSQFSENVLLRAEEQKKRKYTIADFGG